MKRKKIFANIAILLCMFTLCGCLRDFYDEKEMALQELSMEQMYERGNQFFKLRYYMNAVKQYAYVRDNVKDIKLQEKATLGLSRSLLKAKQYDSALGVLQPLPEFPYSEYEALKYAIAGEIFLRQSKLDSAESFMEIALDVDKKSKKTYRAVTAFNLGKCYLANNKTRLALEKFKFARELFKVYNDDKNVKYCESIIKKIQQFMK